MRVLLDENVPVALARELAPHAVETVVGLGWAGLKNGELLQRMRGRFEALVTMDSNLQFQQPIDLQTFGVVLIQARSNRMSDLRPAVPALLRCLSELRPGDLRTVGAEGHV